MKLIATVTSNNLPDSQHTLAFPANTTIPVGTEVECHIPPSSESALPAFGTLMPDQGGFFTGVTTIDGRRYGNVVAPKAQGETSGKWGECGKKIAATHLADGLANTKAMADDGTDVATWALGLDINGHQDWYIPSREELELIYRNLKPTDDENSCSFRDGENLFSVPLGLPYTEASPAQTTVAAFQSGGDEAMESAWYWSSTQYSSSLAFSQIFGDGRQGRSGKSHEGRVRAVRRFLID